MTPQVPEKVLILEDDAGVARLQQRRLERGGFAVVCAGTPDEAMRLIHQGGVDLLVLDNRLAGAEDGLAFYKRLKTAGHDLPVILVTGYSDDATIIQALRAGVRDYIFKSLEYLDYLPEAARRVLDQEHTRQELRAMTQQLWQAAKLASVGELAASVAHELNNPLGTVSLRLEGVLAKMAPNDPNRRPLEIVDQEVQRMARLVGNLLHFSRAARDQVSTVDVREEIIKTIELTEHHLKRRGIRIEPEFHPSAPTIYADRQQLRQVFLNLFTNAGDAMPKGGRLIPRLSPGQLPDGTPAIVVEVSDTGIGIALELLPRVFEPFFTTKEEGKGTGLGLAICRRIVQGHHGTLQIESEVGRGTTVRVTLPVKNTANVHGLRGQ
jgi:signal transduction histidine kinase